MTCSKNSAKHFAIGRRSLAAALLIGSLWTVGCNSSTEPVAPAVDKKVVATNYPLAYFAERLLGQKAKVTFPVPEDADPAHWSPSDESIAVMQSADLIVVNGAGYESWRDTVTLPNDRIIDTTAHVTKSLIADEQAVTHSHGPEGEHTHVHMATHTWLAPHLAVAQSTALAMALADEMRELGPQLTANAVALSEDLVAFDGRFQEVTEASREWHVIGSHPVYQYLGQRLDWNLHSLHWESGVTPSDEEFAALETRLTETPSRLMLWEDEPTPATRQRLEAMGLTIVVYRTCGSRPESGDFLSEMRANLDRLEAAIENIANQPEASAEPGEQ